jgi:hypothetical protein
MVRKRGAERKFLAIIWLVEEAVRKSVLLFSEHEVGKRGDTKFWRSHG